MPALSLPAVCPWVSPSTSLGPAAFDLSDERGLGSQLSLSFLSVYPPLPASSHGLPTNPICYLGQVAEG